MPVSTTTTVASSLNPATAGKVVKFTATVTPAAATGTVTFMDGTTTLGTVNRVGAIATFSTTTLAVGTHPITAVLNATGNYTGSASTTPLTQTIKGNTVTTLATDGTPAIFGQPVTFTATVTPSAVTGTVTFKDGATVLGTGTLSLGQATLTTSTLTVGTHSITAVTAGDSLYNPSTAKALVQTVKVFTTTTATSSLNPSSAGQAVKFTATVTPATATGTVTFKDGTTILGTGIRVGGTATFSTSRLAVGSHSITAVLNATGNYSGSTSPILPQQVN